MKKLSEMSLLTLSLAALLIGCTPIPAEPINVTNIMAITKDRRFESLIMTNSGFCTVQFTEPTSVRFEESELVIQCSTNYMPTNIVTDGYTGTIQLGTNRYTIEQLTNALNNP